MIGRRIISGLVAICTAFLCCSGIAFAKSEEIKLDDCDFEVKVAQGIGAITEYEADKKVTVAEFKKAVDALCNNTDVSGLYFSGQTDAEQEISCMKAASVMCDILGYGVFLGRKSYSEGAVKDMYMAAIKYGLLKGVSEKQEETLTMHGMVSMIYNVLDSKVIDTSYYSTGGWSADMSDEKYISAVLNMEIKKGVVRSTKFSSIVGDEGTGDNTINLDGENYKCDIENAEEYIGVGVKALIKYEDGEKRILTLFDNSKTVAIDADDINDSETNKSKVSYYNEKDRNITLTLSGAVDVLYNFKLFKNWDAEDLRVKQGRLVCIDNDNDGRYDVVKIEEYKSMRVFSVSEKTEKIGGTDGEVLSIKNLIENEYPVYENGKAIALADIASGSVATYYSDKNGEVVRIYISAEVSAGTVRSFNKARNKVKFEEKEYSYTDEIKEKIEKTALGTSIMVYLNFYGEIAYFETAKDSFLYGYMVNFDEGNGIENPRVKIFTQSNEFKIYEAAGRIDFNGEKLNSASAFKYNLNTGLWDEAGKINQVIKYKVNSSDKLTAIRTTTDTDDGTTERMVKEKDGVYRYFSSSQTLSSDTRLSVSKTKVFLIPTDLSAERKFKFGVCNILDSDECTYQIYDIDEDRYADVVVARIDPYGLRSVSDMYGTVYMVDEVGSFISDRDEVSAMATAYVLGETKPTKVELKFNRNDIPISDIGLTITSGELRQGDVIMIAGDSTFSNEIGNIRMFYRAGETAPYEDIKGSWNGVFVSKDMFYGSSQCYTAGKVIKTIKDGVIINNKAEDTEDYDAWGRVINVSELTPVYVLDKNDGKIVQATATEFTPGDKVFSLLSGGVAKAFIIYRNF